MTDNKHLRLPRQPRDDHNPQKIDKSYDPKKGNLPTEKPPASPPPDSD